MFSPGTSGMARGNLLAPGFTMSENAQRPGEDATEGDHHAAEEQEAEERSAPPGSVIYRAITREGEDELSRNTVGLLWSGLAAGLSMGFSLMTEGLLRAHLPDTEWRPLVAKFGYSIGFVVVVLGRQ